MKYFNHVTDLAQAKQHYRTLAKQLHPDAGGTAHKFQKMQDEYKEFLLSLQQKRNVLIDVEQPSPENELLCKLGKLARVLIKQQVPQDFLRHKIQSADSNFDKGLLCEIVDFLNKVE